MRKQMMENAASEVATQVREVEDSIEVALGELAELHSRLVHARGVTGCNYVTIQAAFEKLATTTSSLIEARGGIGLCHLALAEAKQTIPGLRTVGFGDEGPCPKTAGSADLRIVA